MKKKINLMVVYGSGGHQEQARRIINHFNRDVEINKISIIRDVKSKKVVQNCDELIVPELRDKYSSIESLKNIFRYIYSIVKLARYIKKNNPDIIVSPGPGCAILPSAFGRILGVRVIYIESWSRFYELSLTGKVMKIIANDFWVQNEELMNSCEKAKWVGRL